MLIEAALLAGNLSSHLFFSFSFVIAKVTVPTVLVAQHRPFESGFSPDKFASLHPTGTVHYCM